MLLGLAVVLALAQRCPADQPASTSETLIQLSVTPAAAPRPALRYLLLPEVMEMNPGNPIQNYLKCFMEQQRFFFDKEAFERREKLLTMPLQELPAQELQDYGSFALKQADWAARLDNPDWQILLKLKTDGVNLLLPDLQELRALANALKVRFRAEVALGRFDQALRTAKTMFAMSRHLGQHPTLIGDLVGIAVAFSAIGPLDEMLEQPACPNLYWALTNLPSPLVPLDKGIEGERAIELGEFHGLDESAPMSADQLKQLIARLDKVLGESGKPIGLADWLAARTSNAETLSRARRRLLEHGIPEQRLVRFPADQVILLDEKREYEVRRDDVMKNMALPTWQVEALAAQIKPASGPSLFGEIFVPAVYGVRLKQVRLDQRIALLRDVEALRLYAADHKGTLPAKLSDVTVPLADDPFTGRPFRYEVDGTTAHLRGSPPVGMEKDPAYSVHYEITLRK
jgi:hypothetical protein